MEYIVLKYKNKEYGIFAKKCNCFVLFGNKKEMQQRAEKLNKIHNTKNKSCYLIDID